MNRIRRALVWAVGRNGGTVATLTLGSVVFGCATLGSGAGATGATPEPKPQIERLERQNAQQVGRIRELEARLALLEAESRGQRTGLPLSETVRIGGEAGADSLDAAEPVAGAASGPVASGRASSGRASSGRAAAGPLAPREDARPPIRLRLYGQRTEKNTAPVAEPLPPVPVVSERLPVSTRPVSPLPVAGVPGDGGDVALAAPVQPSLALAPAPDPDVKARYLTALRHLKARKYRQAGDAFTLFISAHPAHPLANAARYWLAESRYAERDYRRALALFEQFLSRVSTGDRAAEAMHKAGLCHARLGDAAAAERFFARLRAQFPDSAAVAALTTAAAEGSP